MTIFLFFFFGGGGGGKRFLWIFLEGSLLILTILMGDFLKSCVL